MAFSLVQHTFADTVVAGTSLVKAFGSNVTVNNLLNYWGTGDNAPSMSISDNNTNTIASSVGPTSDPTAAFKAQAWNVKQANAGATTVTLSFSASSSFAGLMLTEHSDSGGNANGFTLDQTAAANGTTVNPASGNTPTTTVANEIVMGFCVPDNGAATAGTGFTIIDTGVATGIADEWKSVTATGAQNATFTDAATPINWIAQCATFFTAASGDTLMAQACL